MIIEILSHKHYFNLSGNILNDFQYPYNILQTYRSTEKNNPNFQDSLQNSVIYNNAQTNRIKYLVKRRGSL